MRPIKKFVNQQTFKTNIEVPHAAVLRAHSQRPERMNYASQEWEKIIAVSDGINISEISLQPKGYWRCAFQHTPIFSTEPLFL